MGAKVEDEDQDRRSKMDKEEEGGRDEADLICSALLSSAPPPRSAIRISAIKHMDVGMEMDMRPAGRTDVPFPQVPFIRGSESTTRQEMRWMRRGLVTCARRA